MSRHLQRLLSNIFLLCFSLCTAHVAFSQDEPLLPAPLTQAAIEGVEQSIIVAHLSALQEGDSRNPQDIIGDIKVVIKFAKSNNLIELEIEAGSSLILVYSSLNNTDEVETLAETYLPQAVNLDLRVPVVRIYRGLLRNTTILGESSRRVAIKQQLFQAIERGIPERQEGLALLTIGTNDFFAREFFSALQILRRAQEIFVRNKLRVDEDRVLSILAIANSRLGNERRAIDIQLKIVERMRQGPKNINWSIIDFNIANSYYDLEEYEDARTYVMRSRTVASELGDKIGVAYANELLAKIHLGEQKLDEARVLSTSAAEVFKEANDSEKQFDALVTLAQVLLYMDEIEQAERVIFQLDGLLEKLDLEELAIDRLKVMALYYQKLDDFEQALSLHRQYHKRFIQLEQTQRGEAIDRLMGEFTNEAQESENRYLEQQNALNQAKLIEQAQRQTILYLVVVIAVLGLLAIAVLIIVQWRKNHIMQELALTDELTGAPNRRACLRAAKLAFDQATAGHHSLIVAVLDLDRFKAINDKYGHDAGDKVLQAFAEAVKSVLRDQDHYGRIGGEEWLLVFPHADLLDMQVIFERLSIRFNELNTGFPCSDESMSFSMGAVSSLDGYDSVEVMISEADKLVYKAKAEGRNQLQIQ